MLKQHLLKWDGCKLCTLHCNRDEIVFFRGTVPCDILFIGEGPGESENAIGKPFVGPAGKQLDLLIKTTFEDTDHDPSIGITNLVCCLPFVPGEDIKPPNATQITACSRRLEELINIAKPKLLVALGKVPAKYLDRLNTKLKIVKLTHPSWLLRLSSDEEHRYSLEFARFTVTLKTAWENRNG